MSKKIKKIIVFLLITVILILPFSASAVTSNGITFTADRGRMWIPTIGTYYVDGVTESDRLYWSFGSPVNDLSISTEFGLFFYLNKSFYGTLKLKIRCEGVAGFYDPVASPGGVSNFNGLYDMNGNLLTNFNIEENNFVAEYTGTVPTGIEMRGYFSSTFATGWSVVVEFIDFDVEYLVDTDSIINNQNANTDKITQNQDENTDKIVGAIEGAQEQEKHEAQSSGNSAMDSVTSVIPNYAGNLSNYFTALTKRMIHEDMTCFITMPSIKIPAIKGLWPNEIVLSEEKTINVAQYASVIPQKILYLVRYLLTLFLIIYCFKELYSIIQYIMTLKGGGVDE